MDCHARFLAASHAFLRERSHAAMGALLTAYALHHVAENGNEDGLTQALDVIERNCRNILRGLP